MGALRAGFFVMIRFFSSKCLKFDLGAISVQVFADAFITNLMVAGQLFGRNKIPGGPVRAIGAKMPGIGT
jgi:hypothetical protein